MTVELYKGKKFGYSHEREAFGFFLQEMLDCYENTDDLYIVIVEPEANTTSWDIIVLTQRAIILIEMKNLGKAKGLENSQIKLIAKESPEWCYQIDNKTCHLRVGEYGNPYRQVKGKRYDFAEWLAKHSKSLPGGPWDRKQALRSFQSWIVVSPGFSEESEIDLPFEKIRNWFKLCKLLSLWNTYRKTCYCTA